MFVFRPRCGLQLCQRLRKGRECFAINANFSQKRSLSGDAQEIPARTPSASRTRRRYVSKLFQNIGKIQPQDLGQRKSYKLMLFNDIIAACYPGAVYMLPRGQRAMEKLTHIIDQEMEAVGGQKISMPTLAPDSLWKASGRWESTGKELFTLQDRHKYLFCLGPTHEELITSLVASMSPMSSKQLPQLLYQITRKFRDEVSPKHGLLRGREFEMKDMYTFDTTEETAMDTYYAVCGAYCNIFDRIGVPYEKVQGHTGNIGGTLSHEFHYVSEIGDDRLLLCPRCDLQINKQIADGKVKEDLCQRNRDNCQMRECNGIEVGHCFYLGTKYSSVFNATFRDGGENMPIHMGCFGLGVTRILQATVELLSKERQLQWPSVLAPYQVCIIPQKEGYQAELYFNLAEELSDQLSSLPNLAGEVVIDDRIKFSIGRRVYDASRAGYPYIIALGKKALEQPQQFEVINTSTEETKFLSRDELMDFMSTLVTV